MRRSRKRSLASYSILVGFVCLSGLVLLVLAEVSVRFSRIVTFNSTLEEGTIVVNSLGYRDMEFVKEKSRGTLRIAVLGDSNAWGYGVTYKSAFPYRLEPQVKANLSQIGGYTDAEVLNFSQRGWNTREQLEVLRDVIVDFAPDILVHQYDINDNNWTGSLGSEQTILTYFLRILAYEAHILRVIQKHVIYRGSEVALPEWLTDYVNGTYEPDSTLWLATQAQLQGMREICEKYNITYMFVLVPVIAAFEDHPFVETYDAVLSYMNAVDVDVVNVFDVLKGLNPQSLRVDYFNFHPNARAHELIAQAIGARMVQTLGGVEEAENGK